MEEGTASLAGGGRDRTDSLWWRSKADDDSKPIQNSDGADLLPRKETDGSDSSLCDEEVRSTKADAKLAAGDKKKITRVKRPIFVLLL